MSKAREKELLAKAVSRELVKVVGRYTYPRTWGVYRLECYCKCFRFGNHPVRADELSRAYGDVELVALFGERGDAKELASLLNHRTEDSLTEWEALNKPKPISDIHSGIESILSKSFKIEDYSAWLLCYFLLITGLRVTEALSCQVKDLNWNKHTLAVKELKTPNHYPSRYLPLPETLLNEIAQWVKLHSLKPEDHLYDFDAATVHNKVRKAFQFAGIDDEKAGGPCPKILSPGTK